jgi:hypothetical protein
MGTAKLFPTGFSRTHVDDGTQLTGCTQPVLWPVTSGNIPLD